MEQSAAKVTPLCVCISGSLLIVVGVNAAIHTLWAILQGAVWLNFTVLGIPIGVGLLSGKSSSRFWTLLMAGGGLVMVLLIGIWFAVEHARGQTGYSTTDLFYGASEVVLIVGGLALVFVSLLKRNIRDWFLLPRNGPASGRSWAVPVLVVGAFFALSELIEKSQWERTLDELFAVHVTVIPYNAETGEGVSDISWQIKDENRWKRPGQERLQKLSGSTLFSREGSS